MSDRVRETKITYMKKIFMKQIHSSDIAIMDASNITNGNELQIVQNVDGLVTKLNNTALAVYGADCCMIAFWDHQTIGVCHAGWRGLVTGVIENMLNHFDREQLVCHIAPFYHSFEIKKDDCYQKVLEKFGNHYFECDVEKIIFHFKRAILSLFEKVYVSIDNRSTFHHYPTLASWRASNLKGNGTQNRLVVWRNDHGQVFHKLFPPAEKIILTD